MGSSGFQTPLCLVADTVPDMWILETPLVWLDPVYGALSVPAGFRTDLASIPRAVRNLPFLDPDGQSRRPATMHDWLYAERSKGKDFADNFLRDSLIAEGASKATANAFYYGVHWFGGPSWASDAGALDTRDFATPQQYFNWKAQCTSS